MQHPFSFSASCKFLPLFVLLILFTSFVGTLLVCSLGWFICLGPFGAMWSFFWSSIRVRVLFVGICSFLVLIGREWRYVSWPRNHILYHGKAFFSLIFFRVVLSKSMCISTFRYSSSTSSSRVILFIHSGFSLFFGYHVLVPNRSVSFASGCWYVFLSSCW